MLTFVLHCVCMCVCLCVCLCVCACVCVCMCTCSIPLTRGKMRCLRDGEWLNDEVINVSMALLQVRVCMYVCMCACMHASL